MSSEMTDKSLYMMLGSLDSKVDSILHGMATSKEDHKQLVERVNALEKWRWIQGGVAAGLGLAGAKISAILGVGL